MKYSIMKDFTDDSFFFVDRKEMRASEIKIFESDSIHECFVWFFNTFHPDLFDLSAELYNEQVWCVYWSDFEGQYYMCPDKGDSTWDDVCFKGSEKECGEYFQKHYIHDEEAEEFNAQARDEQIAWMDDVDLN